MPRRRRVRYRKTRAGICILCGIDFPYLVCDHIIPLFEGGSDEDDNIRFICPNCHAIKTHAERKRWRPTPEQAARKKAALWTPEAIAHRELTNAERSRKISQAHLLPEARREKSERIKMRWEKERAKNPNAIRFSNLDDDDG